MAFYGRNSGHSVRARVLEQNGDIVGVAGYYVACGLRVVFSDMKPGIPMMTIWRESVAMMKTITPPAICFSDGASGPFLERLGWQHECSTPDGEVYKWQGF